MKHYHWLALLAVLIVLFGCDNDVGFHVTEPEGALVVTSQNGYSQSEDNLFYWIEDQFPDGPAVPVRDVAFEDHNVVHIGGEENDVELVILLGERTALPEECTAIYIHECLIPGDNKTVAEGIWRIMDAKCHFSSRPEDERYSAISWLELPEWDEPRPYPGRKLGRIERDIFISRLGLELQGTSWNKAGRMTVAVQGEPIKTVFRFLYPSEL